MALAIVDSLEFDTTQGGTPTLVHVSGDVYAIVYRGVDGDGFVSTVTVDSAGNIGDTVIDTFEFETGNCTAPHIYHISGNIFAITYGGPDSGGWVVTIEISTAGAITDPIVDSHEFDTSQGTLTSMVHISGTTYAIAYTGPGDDGWLKTLTIGNDGSISADPELDSLEFDKTLCYYPYITHISGDIYAILYSGYINATAKYDARMVTVNINSAGAIVDTVVDSFQVPQLISPHTTIAYVGRIFNVAGDIYAFAVQARNASATQKIIVYTIEITTAGAIAATVTDSSEIATTANHTIDFLKTTGGHYVLAYKSAADPGGLDTLDIEENGTIGSVVDSLTFDSTRGETMFLFDITTTVMAIAYTGYGSDGWLKTIGDIEAPTVTTDPATGLAQPIVATLNGTLGDDGGMACDCGFEYGETEAYGTITPTESKNTGETFSQAITGLSPGTVYHFRAIATNPAETSYGSDRIFRTRGQYQGNPHIDQLIYQHVERMGR